MPSGKPSRGNTASRRSHTLILVGDYEDALYLVGGEPRGNGKRNISHHENLTINLVSR